MTSVLYDKQDSTSDLAERADATDAPYPPLRSFRLIRGKVIRHSARQTDKKQKVLNL